MSERFRADDHTPCDNEIARLRSELASERIRSAEALADRDRYIARCKKLEVERDAMREILK